MEERISGVIAHVVYQNEENGYTVFSLSSEDDETTCVGYLGDVREGMSLELTGTYTEHAPPTGGSSASGHFRRSGRRAPVRSNCISDPAP